MKLSAAEQHERGEELASARRLAFELCQENPQITFAELDKALRERGSEVAVGTSIVWLRRFRENSRVRIVKEVKVLKLSGAEQHTRGKELAPARLLAFKLWQENPQITSIELDKALRERGFEVARATAATWRTRFKKGSRVRTVKGVKVLKLSASQKNARGKELTPARLLAFKLWQENPQITSIELDKALKERGFEVIHTTALTWLTRFQKGSRVRTFDGKGLLTANRSEIRTLEEKPPSPVISRKQRIAGERSKITIEEIIKAAGSVEALSLLFYQGVMEELKRRDSAYDVLKADYLEKDQQISGLKRELEEVTRDRNRMMREYNDKMARVKIGSLTLDQTEHRLVPR